MKSKISWNCPFKPQCRVFCYNNKEIIHTGVGCSIIHTTLSDLRLQGLYSSGLRNFSPCMSCTVYNATMHRTLGYTDFNNLVLSGPWWLQNVILRNTYNKKIFPFLSADSSAFAFKVCKKCNKGQKFPKNAIWLSKNVEFYAHFE